MRAFDLYFGDSTDSLRLRPARPGTATTSPDGIEYAGWCGGHAPAIDARSWPRSPYTGLPMIHVITLKLPAEYRHNGDDLVAISLFSAEDGNSDAPLQDDIEALLTGRRPVQESPLLAEVREYVAHRHPQQRDLHDILDGNLALLWLTESEFSGPRTPPPPDRRERPADDESSNAWDDTEPECGVWLAERVGDPNTGIAPKEYPADSPYTVPMDLAPEFVAGIETRSHLGGTITLFEGLPKEISPYFLLLKHEVGGMYFMSILDLKTGIFAAQD